MYKTAFARHLAELQKHNHCNQFYVRVAKVVEIEKTIGDESEKTINVNYFLDLAKKYYDIQKLDCEIIRTFIEKELFIKQKRLMTSVVKELKFII